MRVNNKDVVDEWIEAILEAERDAAKKYGDRN